MPAVTIERDVAAPVTQIWDVFTGLKRRPTRLSGDTAVQPVTEQTLREGTSWHETRTIFGRPYTEQLTIAACRSPERYIVEAAGHGAHYVTEFAFEPLDDGRTHVRVTFGAEPTNLVGKVFNRLMGRMLATSVTKAVRKDLDELAAVAEHLDP